MFKDLEEEGYENYLKRNPFHTVLGIDFELYSSQFSETKNQPIDRINSKITKDLWESVNPRGKIPIPAELDDLIRLHYLVTSRKVTTILEFGVGNSSIVFNHALGLNKDKFTNFVKKELRRSNPFECHSIDNSRKWIRATQRRLRLTQVKFHFSKCRMREFNGRICTLYDRLPNVSPDFIYIDAPSQFSVKGNIRGVSTRHSDRLPMMADVLAIEPFLLPGTLIVIDGRAANARFIKANLQRDWDYFYEPKYDQHFFELRESALGRVNYTQLKFSQGE